MLLILSFTFSILILLSPDQENPSAKKIVDKCIAAHGGKKYENCSFEYDFRDKHYSYSYKKGSYKYTRSFQDKNGDQIEDILTNSGFMRIVNNRESELEDKKAKSFANSVNSVHYFAFLPFFLNDKAVNKEVLGETSLDGQDYYEIKVTFDQEAGGDDYHDIHMYWINKETFTMDYLGYSFLENGGGVRFRKAYNARVIGGIRFQDYINYKFNAGTPVDQLDNLFAEGRLEELSRIELKNISPN